MKLNLNNKIFEGRYNENGQLIIPLDDDFDKLFFKKWQDKSKNGAYKRDYIEDVDFVKVTERGTLKNCFPILSANEDFVVLIYDFYEVVP
jgi:hypothetical protein